MVGSATHWLHWPTQVLVFAYGALLAQLLGFIDGRYGVRWCFFRCICSDGASPQRIYKRYDAKYNCSVINSVGKYAYILF